MINAHVRLQSLRQTSIQLTTTLTMWPTTMRGSAEVDRNRPQTQRRTAKRKMMMMMMEAPTQSHSPGVAAGAPLGEVAEEAAEEVEVAGLAAGDS